MVTMIRSRDELQAGYNDLNSMMQAIEQQDLLQRAEKFG